MFTCRASSRGWKAGLCLAIAHALLAPGLAGADPTPASGLCLAVSAPVGNCAPTTTSTPPTTPTRGRGKGGPAAPPPSSASAPAASAVPGIINLALSCGGGCATPPERAVSAAADTAAWPGWATAHLAADDNIRLVDHVVRGILLVLAVALAILLAWQAVKLAIRSSDQAKDGKDLRFTSHWGGFGGSTGGWQVTPALVSLLGAGLLALTAAVVAGCVLDSMRPQAPTTPAMPGLKPPGGAAAEAK